MNRYSSSVRRSCAPFTLRTPPVTSEWPARNFVAEVIEMSAPSACLIVFQRGPRKGRRSDNLHRSAGMRPSQHRGVFARGDEKAQIVCSALLPSRFLQRPAPGAAGT